MHNYLIPNTGTIEPIGLTAALTAEFTTAITGISTGKYGVIVHFVDDPTEQQMSDAVTTTEAHDPVFLSADKVIISAGGVDEATISVRAPKAGAAPVVLVVDGEDVPVELAYGIGSITVSALDETTFTISVKNPENRTGETLTIQAV